MGNATERNDEVVNEALALSSVGGDREFLTELVGLVQAALPTLLADIRGAMAVGDLPAVERAARLARAAAHYVSAKRAYDSAAQLAMMTGTGDMRAAQRASASLEQEVEKLRVVLPSLVNSGCSL